ncbi:DUF6624 domain-containing protein [Paraglaciecola aestuariivivens]
MRYLLIFSLFISSTAIFAQDNPSLSQQLIKMAEQSQEIQQKLAQYQDKKAPEALSLIARQIDKTHTQTLNSIIELHGWPTQKLVGTTGVIAAFTLVNHASNLSFQQTMLPLIIQSYLDQEGLSGQDVAELTDNVYLKQGKAQVFGTQADWLNGQVVFLPIEDQASVDQLRAQLGLAPLAEYKKWLQNQHQN